MVVRVERRFYLGLDLGQSNDRSALAVLERTLTRDEWPNRVDFTAAESVRYDVRHLERPPLGTSYPDVVSRVAEICGRLADRSPGCRGELVVDGTGVGRPVCDLLRASKLPYPLVAVSITGGEDERRGLAGRISVPKRDLIASLVVMFQGAELRIAERLPEAAALVHELVNFRQRVSAGGHDSYGNGGAARNDDLVLAAALAAWRGALRRKKPLTCGLPLLVI